VDSTDYRYLVCVGYAKAIDAVYKDGVLVATSAYSVVRSIVNGRLYTLIDFTSTQGSSDITCDAQGYETVGDGTGSLIEDPPDMLKHLLDNFVYADYTSGTWLSGDAPVDTSSFATTFFSGRGYKASAYIAEKRKAIDIITDFLTSFEAKAYWTPDGEIALAVENFNAFSYETTNVLREGDLLNVQSSWPSADVVDEIRANYAYNPVLGDFGQQLRVIDRSTGEDAPEDLDLPYSPSFVL
jgi:hypothetical protein